MGSFLEGVDQQTEVFGFVFIILAAYMYIKCDKCPPPVRLWLGARTRVCLRVMRLRSFICRHLLILHTYCVTFCCGTVLTQLPVCEHPRTSQQLPNRSKG